MKNRSPAQDSIAPPLPARMSELLEEIHKHEAEVRREFPDWKWRAVMDLLSKDKEMAA